jgi:hypothetical protein
MAKKMPSMVPTNQVSNHTVTHMGNHTDKPVNK